LLKADSNAWLLEMERDLDLLGNKSQLSSKSLNFEADSLEAEFVQAGINLDKSIIPKPASNISTNLICNTIDLLQVFHQHSNWIDNIKYQCNNIEEAT